MSYARQCFMSVHSKVILEDIHMPELYPYVSEFQKSGYLNSCVIVLLVMCPARCTDLKVREYLAWMTSVTR